MVVWLNTGDPGGGMHVGERLQVSPGSGYFKVHVIDPDRTLGSNYFNGSRTKEKDMS